MTLHEQRRSKTVEWYTPPEVFEALGLGFDLDPCAPKPPAAEWIPARERYSLPEENGLALPWRGRVWLNPPYGDGARHWVGRLADHGDGIALIFVRSDTGWWQSAAARADAVLFVRGRMNFRAGDPRVQQHRSGVSPAPSCMLAYGEDCAKALRRSGLGLVTTLDPVDFGQLSLAPVDHEADELGQLVDHDREVGDVPDQAQRHPGLQQKHDEDREDVSVLGNVLSHRA